MTSSARRAARLNSLRPERWEVSVCGACVKSDLAIVRNLSGRWVLTRQPDSRQDALTSACSESVVKVCGAIWSDCALSGIAEHEQKLAVRLPRDERVFPTLSGCDLGQHYCNCQHPFLKLHAHTCVHAPLTMLSRCAILLLLPCSQQSLMLLFPCNQHAQPDTCRTPSLTKTEPANMSATLGIGCHCLCLAASVDSAVALHAAWLSCMSVVLNA
jgi:hypothetical protein